MICNLYVYVDGPEAPVIRPCGRHSDTNEGMCSVHLRAYVVVSVYKRVSEMPGLPLSRYVRYGD